MKVEPSSTQWRTPRVGFGQRRQFKGLCWTKYLQTSHYGWNHWTGRNYLIVVVECAILVHLMSLWVKRCGLDIETFIGTLNFDMGSNATHSAYGKNEMMCSSNGGNKRHRKRHPGCRSIFFKKMVIAVWTLHLTWRHLCQYKQSITQIIIMDHFYRKALDQNSTFPASYLHCQRLHLGT